MQKLTNIAIIMVLALSVGAGSSWAAKPGRPANVSTPSLTGAAAVGDVISTSEGVWTGSAPMSFSYRWQRCDPGGTKCGTISGASAASYTMTAADQGAVIRSSVTAKNPAGSSTAVSPTSAPVTVGSGVDTTAPTAPAALVLAAVTQSSLTLTWAAATDNVGVAGYRAYRDSVLAGTTASLSFVYGGLACGTSYALSVEAFDAAGNTSARTSTNAATAACSSGGGGTPSGGLRVQGNRIVDAVGNQIVLHGVNRSGTEYACQDNWGFSDGPITEAALQKIADWKASSVRVLLNERCWNVDLAGNPWDGPAYRSEIAAYVERLTRLGLVPIVSLMWSAPGTQSAYNAPMPNRDNSPRFWSSVANTFKANGSVIFDLLNEPYPDGNRSTAEAWRCWKSGGTCAGISYQVAGMQELVDTIRATGATNILSLPGVQYANNLTGWLANKPSDPLGNLVASWHIYEFNLCNNLSCYEGQVAPVIAQVPVLANEIGAECASGTGWASTLINWLDGRATGYNAWTWNVWGACNHSLITSYDTGAPTAWGAWYRDHITALRPVVIGPDTTAPVVSADPKGGTFGPGISVRLGANEPAAIHYTLDGTEPTTASAVYSSSITLDTSTTIRFFAVDAAGNRSTPSSESYTIDTSVPALTIEAESMRLNGGYGGPIANAAASAGKVLYIWNVDTATLQLTTPFASRIAVRAYGTDCEGPPHLVVRIDGAVALESDVTSSGLASYSAPFPLAGGVHTITVSYTNEYASSACNRNLWVDRIDLYG